nr:MAG TPA: hypothetical protein [Caudoviricetes sp.]
MTTKDAIKNFLLKLKSMDESTVSEEVVDAACEMAEEVAKAEDEEIKETEVEETETKDECKDEDLEEKIEKKVSDALNRALAAYGIKDASTKALDELEAELEKKEEEKDEDPSDEESVTIDPEKIEAKDSAEEVKKAIRDMKPVLAAIEDPIARKKATDAFVKMARMNMSTTSTYADIQSAIGNNGKKANDSKPIVTDADYDHGMDIAKRFNPHYMKEGK